MLDKMSALYANDVKSSSGLQISQRNWNKFYLLLNQIDVVSTQNNRGNETAVWNTHKTCLKKWIKIITIFFLTVCLLIWIHKN